MKYAIIAAGEGQRLAQEGVSKPKALVSIGGESLIDRLLRVFAECGAGQVAVVCREEAHELRRHLVERQGKPSVEVIARSTDNPVQSLWALNEWIAGEPVVVTTVDTVFRADEFKAYTLEIKRLLSHGEADGLMGVTELIDDERPLYVETTEQLRITAFSSQVEHPRYVSAGIYGLSARALPVLEGCIRRGSRRLRDFQQALLREGLHLQAWPMTEVVDVDHAADILKAENAAFGQKGRPSRRVLMIQRAERYSPGSVARDKAILDAVAQRLRHQGDMVEMISEEQLEKLIVGNAAPQCWDVAFTMARGDCVIDWLQTMGRPVVNSPESIRGCRRMEVTQTMQRIGTPTAPTEGTDGYWLKQADGAKGEVRFARNREELERAKAEMQQRGITQFIVQAHVKGREVKFYGVVGRFFRTEPQGMESLLRPEAERLAEAVGVSIYGGDAIIGDEERLAIIDLNDWPSFATCVNEAAEVISEK